MTVDALRPFATALAIGLMLGFEREWSHRDVPHTAGSRTFAMLALAGALAAAFGPVVLAAGTVAAGAVVAATYLRTSAVDRGATTEAAALASFLLGALARDSPQLAVALGVVAAVLLLEKARLHHLARDVVTEVEVRDAAKFFLVAFVVLPLLPDRELGPYGVVNPARIWFLVVALTGLGWAGYVAVRALGARRGLLVAGFAGGFISASATTGTMGRAARVAGEARSAGAMGGALLASLATFVQLGAVLAVANRAALGRLWPALVAGGLVVAGEAAFLTRRGGAAWADQPDTGPQTTGRPFALRPALLLAALLTTMLLVARWGADVAGPAGAVLAAAAAGLADVHAASVAVASLAAVGQLPLSTAVAASLAALATNTLTKTAVAFASGGRAFGLAFLLLMAPTAAAVAAVLLLTGA
jgi:uncharacterized membrane protein (DUF4010 family)